MTNEIVGKNMAKTLDMEEYQEVPDKENKVIELKPKTADFHGAQEGIRRAAEIGEKAMEELSGFAEQSQHPRNYEALTELLKAVVHANEKLLDIKKTQQDIEDKAGHNPRVNSTHNTMIVGSTKEMSEY